MPDFTLDRPATSEEVAAIAAALAAHLADEAVLAPPPPAALAPWRAAARVESLGLVRRIPGKLDLRFMGAPTRERLTRPLRRS